MYAPLPASPKSKLTTQHASLSSTVHVIGCGGQVAVEVMAIAGNGQLLGPRTSARTFTLRCAQPHEAGAGWELQGSNAAAAAGGLTATGASLQHVTSNLPGQRPVPATWIARRHSWWPPSQTPVPLAHADLVAEVIVATRSRSLLVRPGETAAEVRVTSDGRLFMLTPYHLFHTRRLQLASC